MAYSITDFNYATNGYTDSTSTTQFITLDASQNTWITQDYKYDQPKITISSSIEGKPADEKKLYSFPFKRDVQVGLLTQLQGEFDAWTDGLRKEIFA